MSLHKLLFRLDFDLNFRIVDSPGRVLELFTTAGDDFWDGFTEGKERTLGAKFAKGSPTDTYRMISVQPKTFVAVLESADSIDSQAAQLDENVSAIFRLADRFTEEFGIQNLGRAGLRTWQLTGNSEGHPPKQNDDQGQAPDRAHRETLQKLLSHISDKVTKPISTFGAITDSGLGFDGAVDDRFKYHFRCGPLSKQELLSKDYFSGIKEAVSERLSARRIYDVDIYEESFSLKGRRISSWLKAQLARSFDMVSEADRAIWG